MFYKHWSQIFNNDSTLTSAILDRVLHHADTVIIEGKALMELALQFEARPTSPK